MAESVLDGLPPFQPRLPWWGPDLQTLRSTLLRRQAALDHYPGERLFIPLDDGSGDKLSAVLNHPQTVAAKPLVVLIHGLTGLEDSYYMRETAAHLLANHYPVLRLNLRGAGRSRPFCKTQYHAGSSDDLARVFEALPQEKTRHGVVAAGFSLGANQLIKYLGERGTDVPLKAAAVISAPLDLAGTSRLLDTWRNHFYQRYLLKYMKLEALAPPQELAPEERGAIRRARSVWQFDHVYSARRHGFRDAADYYERCASGKFLAGVKIPLLLVHALDDPWIPPQPYLAFDWRAHPNLTNLVTRQGGHVGFHGRDPTAWHDLAVAHYFGRLNPS